MTTYTLKNSIFVLQLMFLFIPSSYGQTSATQTPNNINTNTEKEQHPKIVRTMGTKFENVSCQILDKAGNLWFGTKWFGLSRYNGKTFKTFSKYDN